MIKLFQYYRIISAYLILLIHQQFWHKPTILGKLTSIAVPLFAAMSGFLFAKTISSDFDLKTVLVKKAQRILVPYLIWAVIYWIANCVILDGFVRHDSVKLPSLRSWLLGGTACHLWFLPCLFIMIIVFIFIGKIAQKTKINYIWFSIIVLLISALTQLIPDKTSATLAGYVRIYFGRCAFYFVLGTIMYRIVVSKSLALYWGGAAILLGCVNIAFQLLSGLIWNPLLLVIGLMLIAQNIQNIRLPKWITKLSDASMGIYLIHVLFTSTANFALQKIDYMPLPQLIGFILSIILFVASFLTVYLLPKKLF